MQISGKDLVSAINFLKTNVKEVRFMMENDHSWYVDKVPSAIKWNGGDIVIVPSKVEHSSVVCALLQKFGILAKIVSVNGGKDNAVKFAVEKADDDMVYILDMAMTQGKQQKEQRTNAWALRGLNQEVNALLAVLSHARAGIFHRGVKAVSNQASVVAKVMEIHQQQIQNQH